MELKEGYKQTDIGVIPEDWSISEIIEVASIFGRIGFRGYTKNDIVSKGEGAISLGPSNILDNQLSFEKTTYISWAKYDESPEIKVSEQDVLLVKTGSTGKTCLAKNLLQECTINPQLVILKPKANRIDARLLSALVSAPLVQSQIEETVVGGVLSTLSQREIGSFKLPIPPIEEQRAIAEVLSDVDAEIESLAQRYEKLVAQKQGLSEELLSGRTRMVEPKSRGFKQTEVGVIPEDWELTTIDASCSILDSQRIPLNSNERLKRQGIFPYCGANGILDFVDDFLIDDEVVLLAEDGGQFDEFKTRPICYHFKGKFWPNNHVHVLKGGAGLETKYLFFHFEHKDITPFINGGTRSKLNQGDMREIKFSLPPLPEQHAIAEVLSDVDAEIQAVAKLKAKVQAKKEGLMQTLLTGKIRLN